MRLLLVQHGQALSEAEDPGRPLSGGGIVAVTGMAQWLHRQDIAVDHILHSGKTRAAQTADLFAASLHPVAGVASGSGLNPNDDVRDFAEHLPREHGALMVVGHLPFLARLAGLLSAGDANREVVGFQNAGVVCLEDHGDAWRIAWAVTPALLTGTNGD